MIAVCVRCRWMGGGELFVVKDDSLSERQIKLKERKRTNMEDIHPPEARKKFIKKYFKKII